MNPFFSTATSQRKTVPYSIALSALLCPTDGCTQSPPLALDPVVVHSPKPAAARRNPADRAARSQQPPTAASVRATTATPLNAIIPI